jgi:hypothetical protein
MADLQPARSKFDELRDHLEAERSLLDPMAWEIVNELEDIIVRASRVAESEMAGMTQQVLQEAFSR